MLDGDSTKSARFAKALVEQIIELGSGRKTRIVHVCGTHEDTICQHGCISWWLGECYKISYGK